MAKEVTIQLPIKKWEAFDGTQFDVKEECQKYEKAAINVVKKRLMEKSVRELTTAELNCIEYGLGDSNTGYLLKNDCFDDIQMFQSLHNCPLWNEKKRECPFIMIQSEYDDNVWFLNLASKVKLLNDLIEEING